MHLPGITKRHFPSQRYILGYNSRSSCLLLKVKLLSPSFHCYLTKIQLHLLFALATVDRINLKIKKSSVRRLINKTALPVTSRGNYFALGVLGCQGRDLIWFLALTTGAPGMLVWGRKVRQNHTLGRDYVLSGKNPIVYNSSSTATVTIAFKLLESSQQGWICLKSNLVTITGENKA